MKRGLHHTLYNLGITARAQEDYDSARAYLQESMRVAEELGGKTEIASALVDLDLIYSATGQADQALELAATAYARPLSAHIIIWNSEPVRARALALRSSVEGTVSPEASLAAWQRGLEADFDRVVANLIETSTKVETAQIA